MLEKVIYYDKRPPHIEKLLIEYAKPGIDLKFYEPSYGEAGSLEEAEAILAHSRGVTREIIDRAPNLKIIQVASVGYNQHDIEYAREKGIYVCNCAGGASDCVAEMVIGLMLSLTRRITQLSEKVRQGEWHNWTYRHDTHTIIGKTLGVIGAGGIGRAVLKRCRAFDMRELYYDVVRMPEELERELGAEYVDLETLLRESDVVMILVPLLPSTYHLLGRDQFRLMKKNAIVINDSRGECIDQEALVEALREHWIWGAALDVVYPEPLPADAPLLQLKDANVIVTPHLGSATTELMEDLFKVACGNVIRALDGERPDSIVNGL
ncbi:MAG: D-glycerate dehydrogenase [Oscillospiraceae bacterium]|nr:D-glycerate dehydrogenase [Oscillospiraceae bacterium]